MLLMLNTTKTTAVSVVSRKFFFPRVDDSFILHFVDVGLFSPLPPKETHDIDTEQRDTEGKRSEEKKEILSDLMKHSELFECSKKVIDAYQQCLESQTQSHTALAQIKR